MGSASAAAETIRRPLWTSVRRPSLVVKCQGLIRWLCCPGEEKELDPAAAAGLYDDDDNEEERARADPLRAAVSLTLDRCERSERFWSLSGFPAHVVVVAVVAGRADDGDRLQQRVATAQQLVAEKVCVRAGNCFCLPLLILILVSAGTCFAQEARQLAFQRSLEPGQAQVRSEPNSSRSGAGRV